MNAEQHEEEATVAKKVNASFRTSPTIRTTIFDDYYSLLQSNYLRPPGVPFTKEIMFNAILLALYDVECGGGFDFEAAREDGLALTLFLHGLPVMDQDIEAHPESWEGDKVSKSYWKYWCARKSALKGKVARKAKHPDKTKPITSEPNGVIDKAIKDTKAKGELKALPAPTPKAKEAEKPAEVNQPAYDPFESYSTMADGHSKAILPPSVVPNNAIGGNLGHTTGRAEGKKKSTH